MDFLHLTSKKNLNSILKHGILPSPISIPSHWESFKRDGLKTSKCIYTWGDETYRNGKFVKDMIYTKWFIQPRNTLYDDFEDNIDFRRYGTKIYGNDTIFYLLKISNETNKFRDYLHMQEPNDNKVNTIHMMDEKYAHDDKPLYIFEKTILPANISVVERINARVYKNNTLGFSFSKVI